MCGQPEQKNGLRTWSAPSVTAAMDAAETRFRYSYTRSMCGPAGRRSAMARATSATDSEPSSDSRRMALLVDLADHLGLGVGRQIVERGAGLGLQQRSLMLDHHQGLETPGEGAQAGRFQWPRHADLVE